MRKLDREGLGLQRHKVDQAVKMTLRTKRAISTISEQRRLRLAWCFGGSGVVGREAAAGHFVIARLVLSLATSLSDASNDSTPTAAL